MAEKGKSYSQILRSSSIVGGSQAITLLIGIVQTKFVAIFLGPLGVGLSGTFGSVLGIVGRLAGLGVAGSAVREIADANASGDVAKLGKTVASLRLLCWLTGLVGALALAVLAKPVSRMTFGTEDYWWSITILATVVLIRRIQNGQMAYIQGLRRIGDLARLKILGAIAGSTVGVGFYVWLGIHGIVPALLALAIIDLIASWFFARRAGTPVRPVTRTEFIHMSKKFVGLGVILMWSGLLSALVAYLTRVMIIHYFDLNAAGIYQSAFRISGMFVGFILGAMGADFYPRLTGVAADDSKVNQLVNEQTEIGLLLAVPGLLATIACAPWIISILYTAKFAMAADLLVGFVLGCLGRVVSWPMGIILLAKGCRGWLFFLETITNALHIVLIWGGLVCFGLIGVSYAYALLYLFHIVCMMLVANRITGFKWSRDVIKLLVVLSPATALVVAGACLFGRVPVLLVGGGVAAIVGLYCVAQLSDRLGEGHKINRILRRLPVASRLAGGR